jgi:hypothetical protein
VRGDLSNSSRQTHQQEKEEPSKSRSSRKQELAIVSISKWDPHKKRKLAEFREQGIDVKVIEEDKVGNKRLKNN